MSDCRIEKTANGYKIFGLINFETAALLYKQGIDLLNESEEVRLDFTDVIHADSSAIALLLSWLRFAKQKSKSFLFVNLPAQLREIANVCEVMPVLAPYIYNDSGFR